MRVAIVGSGIAGLGCAWLLRKQGDDVTLFEANDYLGGHTHTVDVSIGGVTTPVDTGFLVYNDRTYPKLIAMFDELGVASAPSTMSFSVRNDKARMEWAGTSLGSLFAQPSNLVRAPFWSMLSEIRRFNHETTTLRRTDRVYAVTLGEFLEDRAYSASFREWYLLPMAAAIWSLPKAEILEFPLPNFVDFCDRHGLLQIRDRPRWRTVVGGARTYVERIAASITDVRLATPVARVVRRDGHVEIDSAAARGERFDHVVMACHSDQAASLLADATPLEASLLGGIRYQPNRVVLHTDQRLMPTHRRAWAAWNYMDVDDARTDAPVTVSYWLNRLQPLPFRTPLFITLNPPFEPQPDCVLGEFDYSHPVVKTAAVTAQMRFANIQGERQTWYAGAWLGHGFHEDGLASAHAVAQGIEARMSVHSDRRAAA